MVLGGQDRFSGKDILSRRVLAEVREDERVRLEDVLPRTLLWELRPFFHNTPGVICSLGQMVFSTDGQWAHSE